MRFRTVPCARSGDIPQYRLQLESDNDNIVELGAIADELRMAGLNLRVEAVDMLSRFADTVVYWKRFVREASVASGDISFLSQELPPESFIKV